MGFPKYPNPPWSVVFTNLVWVANRALVQTHDTGCMFVSFLVAVRGKTFCLWSNFGSIVGAVDIYGWMDVYEIEAHTRTHSPHTLARSLGPTKHTYVAVSVTAALFLLCTSGWMDGRTAGWRTENSVRRDFLLCCFVCRSDRRRLTTTNDLSQFKVGSFVYAVVVAR